MGFLPVKGAGRTVSSAMRRKNLRLKSPCFSRRLSGCRAKRDQSAVTLSMGARERKAEKASQAVSSGEPFFVDHSLSLAPPHASPLNMYNYDMAASLEQQESFRKASDPHYWSMTPNSSAQASAQASQWGIAMTTAGKQIIMPQHPQNEPMIRRNGEEPVSRVPDYARGNIVAWAEQPMPYIQRDHDPRHWQFYPSMNRWSQPP